MKILDRLRRKLNSEEGQGLVEYGLILGLVTLICIAALSASGAQVNGIIQKVAASLSTVS